jgi:hypothetical protein
MVSNRRAGGGDSLVSKMRFNPTPGINVRKSANCRSSTTQDFPSSSIPVISPRTCISCHSPARSRRTASYGVDVPSAELRLAHPTVPSPNRHDRSARPAWSFRLGSEGCRITPSTWRSAAGGWLPTGRCLGAFCGSRPAVMGLRMWRHRCLPSRPVPPNRMSKERPRSTPRGPGTQPGRTRSQAT